MTASAAWLKSICSWIMRQARFSWLAVDRRLDQEKSVRVLAQYVERSLAVVASVGTPWLSGVSSGCAFLLVRHVTWSRPGLFPGPWAGPGR